MMGQYKKIVVCGPTATGKTEVAIAICNAFNGEVISADSMQVYKGLDIGSAKPSASERQGVAHHMMDVADAGSHFSAGHYRELAKACLDDILSRGKLPVICGGTGLYIDSLLSPADLSGGQGDEEFRSTLEKLSGSELWEKLNEIDETRAAKLHINDRSRIIRALEIFQQTGKKPSEAFTLPQNADRDVLFIGLNYNDRSILYNKIDSRVDKMVEQGLLNEVKKLLDSGLNEKNTALAGIGYKELVPYFSGDCALDTAVELIKQHSRQYAKRQISWFKRNIKINWFMRDLPGGSATEIVKFCASMGLV